MLALIVWDNRAQFSGFGEDTAAARAIIDQAIVDWSITIDSFNYRNVGKSGWAPHSYYVFNVGVADLPTGRLGEAKPIGIDKDGKPFSGLMTLDADASNGEWYFDP
ncbi:MAG: hypothetical protein ABL921_23100, partial [Pirellula sp.]